MALSIFSKFGLETPMLEIMVFLESLRVDELLSGNMQTLSIFSGTCMLILIVDSDSLLKDKSNEYDFMDI